MKKILTLLALVFLSTQYLSAQVKSNDSSTRQRVKSASYNDPEFNCTQLSTNDKTQVSTFTGNVSFRFGNFECSNAEKVVYDKKAKKLLVYGPRSFAFGGTIAVKETTSKETTLEYTLGEDTVYVL